MKFDKAYFIAKFTAIPDELWTVGAFQRNGQCCALGHCGHESDEYGEQETETEEGKALTALFKKHYDYGAVSINDDNENALGRFPQETPKARRPEFSQRSTNFQTNRAKSSSPSP